MNFLLKLKATESGVVDLAGNIFESAVPPVEPHGGKLWIKIDNRYKLKGNSPLIGIVLQPTETWTISYDFFLKEPVVKTYQSVFVDDGYINSAQLYDAFSNKIGFRCNNTNYNIETPFEPIVGRKYRITLVNSPNGLQLYANKRLVSKLNNNVQFNISSFNLGYNYGGAQGLPYALFNNIFILRDGIILGEEKILYVNNDGVYKYIN
jgi:hypothetical protein